MFSRDGLKVPLQIQRLCNTGSVLFTIYCIVELRHSCDELFEGAAICRTVYRGRHGYKADGWKCASPMIEQWV